MIMETQLEIVCKPSYGPQQIAHETTRHPCNGNSPENSDQQSASSTQWLESTFQGILNKLRELARPDKQSHHHHKNIDDDWEIPFERIRIFPKDYQRSGSQGHVFYGMLSNTPVAVKQVRDVSLTKIKHLRELNHKNVIKFRGISENSNYYYIIMEWCRYGTLHDIIHSGRQLDSRILSSYAQQIATGMKYLHSRNIIHRDLKPTNILVAHHDVLKISDFGAHKVFNEKQTVSYAGTHAYMAPEMIRSEPYSFPIDVWSYGIVLWEILIGETPYNNLASSAVVWAVGNNSFRLPVPSNLPRGFTQILNGCWKAQPAERLTFPHICIILKGAINEVYKISKERWLPLRAGWKREVRDQLDKALNQYKSDPDDDQISRQKQQALDEAIEQVNKRRNKNNDLFLRLQECSMHLNRERADVQARQESVANREKVIVEREDSVARREFLVATIENEWASRNHEFNRLKEQLSLIKDELDQRGIKLDCLQPQDRISEPNAPDSIALLD